jgi:hypothetical protein
MKKAVVLLLTIAACSVFAQTRGLGLEAGYTSVDFSDVNNMLEDWEGWDEALGYSVDKTNFGSALYLALLYDQPVRSQFVIGPKIEYIRVFSSEYEARASGTSMKSVMSVWLVPIMFGGKYYLPLSNPLWAVCGSAYLGLALGGSLQEVERTNYWRPGYPNLNNDFEAPASGSNWIIELGVNVERSLVSGMSLLFGLEYRACELHEMEYTEDVTDAGINDGDEVEYRNGRDVKFDYSGVKLGIGIKMGL